MKIAIISLLFTCMLLPLGCVNKNVSQARLGQEFFLAIGQAINITGEDLKVKFIEVVEDSRCPSDVECLWEGKVSCIIELSQNGITDKTVLTQPGLIDGYAVERYRLYELKYRIEPYPESTKKINSSDYRLLLTFSK